MPEPLLLWPMQAKVLYSYLFKTAPYPDSYRNAKSGILRGVLKKLEIQIKNNPILALYSPFRGLGANKTYHYDNRRIKISRCSKIG